MKHRHVAVGFVAIAACPLAASFAVAQDTTNDPRVAIPVSTSPAKRRGITIEPRATIGYQYYEFDVAENSDVDVKTDYAIGGLGLSGQYGRFFADLYGQTNITDAEDSESLNNGLQRDSDVNRYEINLTAGFAITPMIAAFGGLKYARSKVDSDFSNDAVFDVDVEYFGPFLGGAFSLPVADLGALSLSGSVAYLDGEIVVDAENAVQVINGLEIDGRAIGYNIGLNWVGGLGPFLPALSGVGYSVGVDYSAYRFEDNGNEEFSEKTVRGKFDLKYRF